MSIEDYEAMRELRKENDALKERLALSETDRGSLFARLCETEARLAKAESRQTCEGTKPYICHELATTRARLAEAERLLRWVEFVPDGTPMIEVRTMAHLYFSPEDADMSPRATDSAPAEETVAP